MEVSSLKHDFVKMRQSLQNYHAGQVELTDYYVSKTVDPDWQGQTYDQGLEIWPGPNN